MNTFDFQISQLAFYLTVIFRIATAIIFLKFIIPLQIKENSVKNGLRTLRKELLISGITIFLINTVGLSLIVFKQIFNDDITNFLTDGITIFNSLGFLVIAYLKYEIYHSQYTPKNKQLHARIEQYEKSKLKDKKKGGEKHG